MKTYADKIKEAIIAEQGTTGTTKPAILLYLKKHYPFMQHWRIHRQFRRFNALKKGNRFRINVKKRPLESPGPDRLACPEVRFAIHRFGDASNHQGNEGRLMLKPCFEAW